MTVVHECIPGLAASPTQALNRVQLHLRVTELVFKFD
jgi:hypothetical protein